MNRDNRDTNPAAPAAAPDPVALAEGMTTVESKLESLSDDWRADPALRARGASDPREVLSEYGLDVPIDRDMRIVENTGEVYRFVMPPDPNTRLVDEDLRGVSGGSNCLGSAGTASTVGTLPSTVSSSSTASTASSAA